MRSFAVCLALCLGLAAPGLARAQQAAGPEQSNWDGFYVGAHVGGMVLDGSLNLSSVDVSPLDTQPDHAFNPGVNGTDVVGGLLLGYNYQMGRMVLGAEGDVGFSNAKSTVLSGKTGVPMSVWYSANQMSEDVNGHIRARLGYSVGQFLVYGSAGVALASSSLKVTGYCAGGPYTGEATRTLVGGSIGAGAEYALTQHILLRIEYLFDDYGRQSYSPSNDQPGDDWQAREFSLQTHTFRAALSYRF